MITIFTPVYNRKDTLLRLYESLKRQTVKEFQWIVVDDGSTDGTKELMADFTREEAVDIIYEYQENSGKMRAVNRGVQLAQGEYFL
ncbi:PGL/p-HBAD biosynthesis glycosyltransferase Rv2957/MT3031 [Fusobacterium varium]|nr:glycosyltransferase family A protein [Fusobacterium varium]VEH39594.1 PGL/p-HBAD biosynthesis glycosyltransferase Rv2957/MT3031 [Fusobacterium varium]